MSSITLYSESVMSDEAWSTSATDGSARSLPPSPPSTEIDITEQEITATTTSISTALSATAASSTLTLINDANPPHDQNTFSIDNFEADDDDFLSEIETALADDFIPACISRMESFIQNVDAILDKT